MATASKTYTYVLGSTVTASTSQTILDAGASGDPTAKRRLVHPDSATFPPLVYASNPDRTTNYLRGQVIASPITGTTRTLDDTKLTRYERELRDVIVTEVWTAQGGRKASMTGAQLVQLVTLFLNPPEFNPVSQTYINWEPREGGSKVYQVEIVSLTVRPANSEEPLDVREIFSGGGIFGSGSIQAALDSLESVQTGILDGEVRLTMKVVDEVTS